MRKLEFGARNNVGFEEIEMANNDTDLEKISHNSLKDKILKLRNAIREHRDQRGDDRCWMDDVELYKTLPEGVADADISLLSDEQFRRNCDLFIKNRKCPVPQGAVIGQYVMDRLRTNCPKRVVLFYVSVVGEFVRTGTIFRVQNFKSFEFLSSPGNGIETIDFIKSGLAIRKITSDEGDILYENLAIPREYGTKHKTPEEIHELQTLSFGKEVAKQLKKTSSK